MTSRITYSHKGSKRSRPHTVSDDGYDDRPLQDVPATTPTTTLINHARKRPRVQVEVLLPVSPSKNSPSRNPHTSAGKVSTETPKQPSSSGSSPKKRAHVEVLLPSPHKTTSSPRKIHDVSKPPSGSDAAQIFPDKYLERVRGPQETHSPSPKKRLQVEVLLQSPHRTTPSPQKIHSPLKSSTSLQRRRIMSTEEDSESERERFKKKSKSNFVPREGASPVPGSSRIHAESRAFVQSNTGGSDIDDDDILPVLNIAPKRKAVVQPTPAYASTSRSTAQRVVKERPRPLKATVPKRKSSTGEHNLSTSKLTSGVSTTNLTPLRPKESRPSSSKNTNRPSATFPRHPPRREISASLPGEAMVTSLSRTPVKSYLFDFTSPLTPLPNNSPSKRSPITPSKSLDSVRPSTPRSPAKDLSDLFNFVTPKTGLSKLPDKPKVPLVKRMLARSRTEPSLDAAVSDNRPGSMNSISFSASLRNADTLVDIPAAGASQSASGSGSSAPILPVTPAGESESQTRASAVPQSQIRTYAGKSRSFLVPVPASGVPGALDDDDLGLENTRESYADLRSRWGVDNSEDDPLPRSPSPEPVSGKGKGKAKERSKVVLPSNMMNDLKSITELRSKGESRRFMDEVGYLFEGMGKNVGVGVRRGSALEIVAKLCDAEFARRAKTTDFLSRAWDVLRDAGAGDGDLVLDGILVLFAALVSQTPRDLQDLAQNHDFVLTLCRMLSSMERGKDPIELLSSGASDLELKKTGIGKIEKSTLASLKAVIVKKSGLSTAGDCPSFRQLISQSLSTLHAHHLRPDRFRSIYDSLLSELSLLPLRLSAYAAGLPLLPEPSSSTPLDVSLFEHIDNCLRIIDSFLLGRWAEDDDRDSLCDDIVNGDGQEALADGLVVLCAVGNIMLKVPEYVLHYNLATKCLESALRVLINLSHDNPAWCKLLLHHEVTIHVIASLITSSYSVRPISAKTAPKDAESEIEDEDLDRDAQAFDRLCLALGLLTNLVQADDEAKDICRETKLSPTCPSKRACAKTCQCPDRISAIECLVRAHVQHDSADTEVDADGPSKHIVRGHLAVLFGLLMQQSPANEQIVLDALPGASRREKLDALVTFAKDFVGLYAAFMSRIARGEGEEAKDEAGDDDGDNRERASGSRNTSADAQVTEDVIVFLEMLRDQ